jgi:competence protein ComEC
MRPQEAMTFVVLQGGSMMRRRLSVLVIGILAVALFSGFPYSLLAESPLVATFLNVGQGDCIWLKAPDGQDIVIDGGVESQGQTILSYLRDHGVTDIEVMVLSHPDADHVGGLTTLLRNMPVSLVIHNGQTGTSATYGRFASAIQTLAVPTLIVRAGQALSWGAVSAAVLNPADPLLSGTNDNSVTLRVSYGNVDFFFPGDISASAESDILSRGGVALKLRF